MSSVEEEKIILLMFIIISHFYLLCLSVLFILPPCIASTTALYKYSFVNDGMRGERFREERECGSE
jgi:hypothetical protein